MEKNKYFILTLGSLLLIGTVSALYAGESINYPNPLNSSNLIYTIIDNTSELSVIPIISISPEFINITFPADMNPNSFTIVFLEESTNEVIIEVPVNSGGGSKIKYINRTIIREVPIFIPDLTDKQNTELINQTTKEEKNHYKLPQNPINESQKGSKWFWILAGIIIIWIIYVTINKKVKKSESSEFEN